MTNGRRGQGQRGWWGERGWRQVGAAGQWEREKERRGGRGSGGDEGWRQGKKQRGCRGRKRTRGRGGADPRHEAVREMASTWPIPSRRKQRHGKHTAGSWITGFQGPEDVWKLSITYTHSKK